MKTLKKIIRRLLMVKNFESEKLEDAYLQANGVRYSCTPHGTSVKRHFDRKYEKLHYTEILGIIIYRTYKPL